MPGTPFFFLPFMGKIHEKRRILALAAGILLKRVMRHLHILDLHVLQA
jgi:hypothetical protein